MGRFIFHFLLAFLLFATTLNAQRHGAANSVQNYTRGMSDPEFEVDIETTHKKFRFHASDLQKMRRSTIEAKDPHTNETKTYEGVKLQDLLPSTLSPGQFEILEVSFGLFHKHVLHNTDLQIQPDLIADTQNGKLLKGDMPFFFIAETRQDNTILIKKVTTIKCKGAR